MSQLLMVAVLLGEMSLAIVIISVTILSIKNFVQTEMQEQPYRVEIYIAKKQAIDSPADRGDHSHKAG